MGLNASGKLYKIFDAQQVTPRFRKREFVVEIDDNSRYPQLVMFQLTGNRCEVIDDFAEGDNVDLDFSLRGREWTSPSGDVKYFSSLEVWEVAKVGGSRATKAPAPASANAPTPSPSAPGSGDEPPMLTDDDAPPPDDDPPF